MLSRLSYIFCSLVILYGCFFFYPKWNLKAGEAPTGWDVSGYYWYVPSVVIYKDLKYQRFADSVLQKYQPTPDVQQFTRYPDSSCVLTYSSGMAFMYLPLFTIAHVLAKPLGYPADGFSPPYQFALQVGSMLFALFGLWYFRKLLLLYFEDKVVAVLLLLLVIGTNYLNFAAILGPMTHAWLFTLYTFLLLNTHYFYKKPSYKYALRIGLIIGMQILIRPSEMVAALIPLLWGMERISLNAIKQQLAFLQLHFKKLATAIVCVLLIGSIQLFYWKYTSGHWLVFSYGGDDKGFTWLQPHTFDYLFHYRSGWLMYTPLMILAIIGIIPFIKKGQHKVAILAFFLLNLYVVSAWDIWWYGGLGGRAMIQSYVLLFFPFGALVQTMFEKRLLRWVLIPLFLLFSYINLWVIIQEHRGTGLIDAQSMNKAYYWRVLGRWSTANKDEIEKLKDTDELFEGKPKNMQTVYTNDFENDTAIKSPAPAIYGNVSDYVGVGREYSENLFFTLPNNKSQWLRVQGTFRCKYNEWTSWRMHQLVVEFINKDGNQVKHTAIKLSRYLDNDATKDIYIDTRIPNEPFEKVKVFCWNPRSEQYLLIDNIKAISFDQ